MKNQKLDHENIVIKQDVKYLKFYLFFIEKKPIFKLD